ncbi:hypothetical protein, partial [Streptomyces sp. NPDC041003]|uniref:hypothetical protein n=1 Tax=Streptomyces sp. NPDC041003 TaxID=3155730 RepID=UPI0033FC13C3
MAVSLLCLESGPVTGDILPRCPTSNARRPGTELEAAEGSGAAAEDDGSTGEGGYFPYKPYCG